MKHRRKKLFFIISTGFLILLIFNSSLNDAWLNKTPIRSPGIGHLPKTLVSKSGEFNGMAFMGNEVMQVGVNLEWGGAISELSHAGINLIDDNDTGRLVQVSVYDSEDNYPADLTDSSWGWNPVQGGDKYFHGSPVLDFKKTEKDMYIKTQPLQWNPDNKGGGVDVPVKSNVTLETWLTLSSRWPQLLEVHHQIRLNEVRSITGNQEIPALFAKPFLNRIIGYKGKSAWRFWDSEGISSFEASLFPKFSVIGLLPEKWISLVNEKDFGITLYAPNHPIHTPIIPGISFFHKGGFNTYRTPETIYVSPGLPNVTLKGRGTYDIKYYLIVGNYQDARSLVSSLRIANFNVD